MRRTKNQKDALAIDRRLERRGGGDSDVHEVVSVNLIGPAGPTQTISRGGDVLQSGVDGGGQHVWPGTAVHMSQSRNKSISSITAVAPRHMQPTSPAQLGTYDPTLMRTT